MNFNFSLYEIVLILILIVLFFIIQFAKNQKIYFFISTLTLSILAYCFNPIKAWLVDGNYTDLFRFFYDMELINKLGFENAYNLLKTDYSVIPVMKIVVVLIAKTNLFSILPFIAAFIYYGAFAKIIIIIRDRYKIDKKIISFSYYMFILITNFQFVITNIRVPVGSSLFILILYWDLIENKGFKKCIIPYLLLIGIHPYFIMLIGLRILLIGMNKYNNKIVYGIIILYFTFSTILTNFISYFSQYKYINFLLKKIDFYTNGSADQYFEMSSFIMTLLKTICIIIFLIYIKKCKENKKLKQDDNILKLYDFSKLMCLFSIGSLSNFTIFNRVGYVMTFLLIIWYIFYNNYKKKSEKDRRNLTILFPNLIFYIFSIMQIILLFFGYQYQILCF